MPHRNPSAAFAFDSYVKRKSMLSTVGNGCSTIPIKVCRLKGTSIQLIIPLNLLSFKSAPAESGHASLFPGRGSQMAENHLVCVASTDKSHFMPDEDQASNLPNEFWCAALVAIQSDLQAVIGIYQIL
jgi:hypothetical protein